MKSLRSAVAVAMVVLTAAAASAQSRGSGRLGGKVVDEQGQPVADVVIKAQKVGETEIFEGKTNSKGEWAIARLADGEWKVEFTRDGLETYQMTAKVSEADRGAAVNVTMKKAGAAAPAEDPTVAINAELQRAAGLMQKGDVPGARAIYEALYVKYPQPYQFPFAIATTYMAEKNFEKAAEFAKIAADKDPANTDVKLLHAEILMEGGKKAEAQAILSSVDLTQVKDPVVFINAAIHLINDEKGPEAIALIDKLLVQFPTHHQLHYYRGRANLAAKNLDAARADFEKFVSVAPADSREVADAKDLIAKLTKK